MVTFSRREDVKRWLNKITPEDRRCEIALVVAVRAVLRLIPLLSEALLETNSRRDLTLSRLVLPTLRAIASSGPFSKRQEIREDIRASARFAAAAAFTAAAGRAPHTPGNLIATAANAIASAAGAFADADAVDAAFAAIVTATDGDVYSTDRYYASLMVAFTTDVTLIDNGHSAAEVAKARLWLDQTPQWTLDAWAKLKSTMLGSHNDWIVWTDWYEARLAGKAYDGDIEIARVLIDEDIWQQGPRAVNAEIARLITEHERGRDRYLFADDFDCFVSYATEDEAMAREIVGVLEGAGYRTVARYKDFDIGGNFVELMNRGLSRSVRMVAVYSPHYQASSHCQAEWAFAYNSDPSGTGHRLVPFLIAPTALSPLARQVIYKSLVGLNRAQRKTAILEAFARKPPIEKAEAIQQVLAETASPKASLNKKGQLHAGPNAVFDRPFVDADLAELPIRQRTLADTIRDSLPPNAPRVLGRCLQAYADHLLQYGTQPIVGSLGELAEGLHAELQSDEVVDLGKGISKLFERFFANHELLRTHFPLKHDEVISGFKIDEDKASGAALSDPIKKVDEAAQAVLAIEGATPEFAKAVSNSAAFANDLASLPLRKKGDDASSQRISVKQRYVVGTIGFLVSIYNLIGTTATIYDSATVASLMHAVAVAIDKFMAFLL